MELLALFKNPFLLTSVSGWAVAQIVKVIIYSIKDKKFDWRRIFGAGGMPSAHAATIVSLTTICGLRLGFAGAEFAISMILSIIVCHDAMGVRLETEKQTAVIEHLLVEGNVKNDIKLKKSVGHTLPQIVAGCIVGIATGFLMNLVF